MGNSSERSDVSFRAEDRDPSTDESDLREIQINEVRSAPPPQLDTTNRWQRVAKIQLRKGQGPQRRIQGEQFPQSEPIDRYVRMSIITRSLLVGR
jgi:hypothetical protein